MRAALTHLRSRWPHRRTLLKWTHWIMLPLLIWFVLVQPKDVVPFGREAFLVHSNLAVIFVAISILWTADLMRRGLAGKPGPKLPAWARRFHQIVHKTIIWGLFTVGLTGFLLGLTSSVLLKAGGFLPIAPPMGWRHLNEYVGDFHIIQFYTLAAIVAVHALFHIWRHFRLRDNALRIMVPKTFHKWL
ncbi:MAG: cytochrome B [Amylibacter sp.]|jgi:cytochrome b561|nr:cytochrome B [Amylibacter sp.]